MLVEYEVPTRHAAKPMTFRDVYITHFEFVWRSLRRLGVHEADIPDALQEVFLVVHKRLVEFEGRAKLTTWLFRICLNITRARQKAGRRRKELLDGEFVDLCEGHERDPAQSAIDREGLHLLEHALTKMALEQRAVFVLFELEEMTCQEIADTLDIPLGTVYSRLRLGRESFQKTMRRFGTSELLAQGDDR